jgi:hypothetical protein
VTSLLEGTLFSIQVPLTGLWERQEMQESTKNPDSPEDAMVTIITCTFLPLP